MVVYVYKMITHIYWSQYQNHITQE